MKKILPSATNITQYNQIYDIILLFICFFQYIFSLSSPSAYFLYFISTTPNFYPLFAYKEPRTSVAHLAACAYYYLYYFWDLFGHASAMLGCPKRRWIRRIRKRPPPRLRLWLRLQLGFGCAQLRMLPTSCHLVALAKSVAHVAACHFRICGQKSQKKKDFYIYIYICNCGMGTLIFGQRW